MFGRIVKEIIPPSNLRQEIAKFNKELFDCSSVVDEHIHRGCEMIYTAGNLCSSPFTAPGQRPFLHRARRRQRQAAESNKESVRGTNELFLSRIHKLDVTKSLARPVFSSRESGWKTDSAATRKRRIPKTTTLLQLTKKPRNSQQYWPLFHPAHRGLITKLIIFLRFFGKDFQFL